MASILKLEDSRPEQGRNNIWYRDAKSGRCLVFVHGINSDSRDCWYAQTKSQTRLSSYWPELVRQDERFIGFGIYLGGYKTGLNSTNYNLCDCTDELLSALKRKNSDSRRSVLDCDSIIFVCHSMGGIVVRHLLEKHHHLFNSKAIGLVLMASPSRGSDYADLIGPVSAVVENSQALDLRPGSAFLDYVHYRFLRTMKENRIPRLMGKEGVEHKGLVAGTTPIVPKVSASTYFEEAVLLPDTNHSTCVKPGNPLDRPYLLLADFCDAFNRKFHTAEAISNPAPPAFTCRSIRWEAAIDSEGDAENEIRYTKLTAPDGPVKLMSWSIQSGHSTKPVLGAGTSKKVSLRIDAQGTHFANVMLERTTSEPVDLVIHNWDFNVYSMNRREYALKSSYRSDGVDYLEKWIDGSVDLLEIEVSFPKELKIKPWFSVNLGDSDETEDPALTNRYRKQFHFGQTTRSANVRIEKPATNRAYRISWQVPEAPATPGVASFEQALAKLQSFGAQFFSEPATAQTNLQAAQSVLADLRQLVTGEIQKAKGLKSPPAFSELETTILALDLDAKPIVLRKIASNIEELNAPAELGFEIGDGTAGRAFKNRMIRVYNAAKAPGDPKNNTYIELRDRPAHRFLISIPMLNHRDGVAYAVWNIGTFHAADTHFLAAIAGHDCAESLLRYASVGLTDLLRKLKMEE